MWKFYGEFLIDFYGSKETRNEVRVRPHKRSGAGLDASPDVTHEAQTRNEVRVHAEAGRGQGMERTRRKATGNERNKPKIESESRACRRNSRHCPQRMLRAQRV